MTRPIIHQSDPWWGLNHLYTGVFSAVLCKLTRLPKSIFLTVMETHERDWFSCPFPMAKKILFLVQGCLTPFFRLPGPGIVFYRGVWCRSSVFPSQICRPVRSRAKNSLINRPLVMVAFTATFTLYKVSCSHLETACSSKSPNIVNPWQME